MSWSVSFVGKPDAVVRALEAESSKLSGQCKTEYDDAMPYLIGLVKQTFKADGEWGPEFVKLDASGSGNCTNGVQKSRVCSVTLQPLYGNFVT